ncbi:MAG: Spy/CpxP family protein refolding chaperone [Melioribacteraceae bacterium]
MKKTVLAILIASLLLLGISEVFAQRGKRNNQTGQEKIVNLLKLTDTQLVKFKEIRFTNQESMIDMQANLKKYKLEITKYMDGNDVSKSNLIALTDKASNLHSTMKNSRINMWFEVYNILDADQKILWKKHFRQMGNKQKGMKKQRKGRNCNKGFNRFN